MSEESAKDYLRRFVKDHPSYAFDVIDHAMRTHSMVDIILHKTVHLPTGVLAHTAGRCRLRQRDVTVAEQVKTATLGYQYVLN